MCYVAAMDFLIDLGTVVFYWAAGLFLVLMCVGAVLNARKSASSTVTLTDGMKKVEVKASKDATVQALTAMEALKHPERFREEAK